MKNLHLGHRTFVDFVKFFFGCGKPLTTIEIDQNLLNFGCNINEINSYVARDLEQILLKYQGLVVSCSGGLDSTGLLQIIYQNIDKKKLADLHVLHLNFGLRPSENRVEVDFMLDLCQQLNVKLHLVDLSKSNQTPEHGVQEWARKQRQKLWDEWLEKGFAVAVAHHADDLAENLLLRMCRGTSPAGWAGLNRFDSGLWRPLLTLRKQELAKFMQQNKFSFCTDSSNSTDKYARNQVRHQVLPVLEKIYPNAVKHMCRLSEDVRVREKHLAEQSKNYETELCSAHGMKLEKFCSLTDWQIGNLLSRLVTQGRKGKQGLSRNFLLGCTASIRAYDLKRGGETKIIDFPCNFGRIQLTKRCIKFNC